MARVTITTRTIEGTAEEVAQLWPLGQAGNSGGEPGTRGKPGSQKALSPREREVARLVCQGFTSEVIAKKMDIQYDSVRKHRSHIRQKLGLSDRAGLEAMREVWDIEP